MKKVKISIIALAMLGLAGCATGQKQEPEVEIVYKTRLVQITVPSNLVVNTPVPTPPQKQVYLEATAQDKEGMLTDYANKLLEALTEANTTIDSIRKWGELQKAAFKSSILPKE